MSRSRLALAVVATLIVLPVIVRLAMPALFDVARTPQALQLADGELRLQEAGCEAPLAAAPTVEPLPTPFGVLVWNVYKGSADGWQAELEGWSAGRDLLLLQEAADPPVLPWLLERGRAPVMARAFTRRDRDAGVLTAGGVASACVQLASEPWLGIPKSTLVTRHRLGDEVLLAVNVHGVNFTVGTRPYRTQLDAIGAVLDAHDGPILLAGDFNTWSDERAAELDRLAGRVGLSPVSLTPDHRVRKAGHPLDHALVRGLEVREAQAPAATGSDHNPLLLTLGLAR